MFKYIRPVLGKVLLFLDRQFAPKALPRTPEYQARVDREISKLTLYQFEACPFCIKVRRAAKRMGLSLPLKNVQTDASARTELLERGGMVQVPCLKILKDDGEIQWMYESSDIIRFLTERFAE
jgi:glutaredoxin